MGKIKILDEKTASKIAAGEVIERPASVVKELLENSKDAGAKNIIVYLEKAGKKLIRVIDDGEGMDKEDLKLCFKPHATSKIETIEDLKNLKTFGFRGEALHSIASVSKLTIKSKTENSEVGYQIEIVSSKLKSFLPVGMNKGTEVKVESLFFNLPARKKFLKTDQTELSHILKVIEAFSLSNPEISLKVFHNNKLLLNLPKQTLIERIRSVLKLDLNKFIQKEKEIENLKIFGLIAKPQFVPYLPKLYLTFVNKRPVKTPFFLKKAIKEALHTLVPEKYFPQFILFLELPAYFFDVNIHPKKEEVKFLNQTFIFKQIEKFTKEAILEEKPTFKASAEKRPSQKSFTLKEPQSTYKAKLESFQQDFFQNQILPEIPIRKKYIQVFNTFIIFEKENGIIIADQHAAHERILFEEFMDKFKNNAKEISQPLLIPEILEPSLSLYQKIKKLKDKLERLGFKLEKFGEKTFKITHAPFIIFRAKRSPKDIFLQILNDLFEEKETTPFAIEHLIATLACRSAIKAGDKLSEEEIQKIIKSLEKTQVKYTCPHGRPTHIIITKLELEKLFKRK